MYYNQTVGDLNQKIELLHYEYMSLENMIVQDTDENYTSMKDHPKWAELCQLGNELDDLEEKLRELGL